MPPLSTYVATAAANDAAAVVSTSATATATAVSPIDLLGIHMCKYVLLWYAL
jgi:hypothetical protein